MAHPRLLSGDVLRCNGLRAGPSGALARFQAVKLLRPLLVSMLVFFVAVPALAWDNLYSHPALLKAAFDRLEKDLVAIACFSI